MRICVNGLYRDATPEEEREIEDSTPSIAMPDDYEAAIAALGVK